MFLISQPIALGAGLISTTNTQNHIYYSDQISNGMKKVAKNIHSFFYHCYLDVRLFIRSVSLMGKNVTDLRIDRRIIQVMLFRQAVVNCGDNLDRILNCYQNHIPEARRLFFYVNQNSIQILTSLRNPEKISEMKSEMIRECDKIIAYQRSLRFLNRLLNGGNTTYRPRRSSVSSTEEPLPRSDERRSGVILTVPGTIPYQPDQIPSEVQNKAQLIERLKGIFESLPQPVIPDAGYICPITQEIMSFPVFDASHPTLQDALNGDPTDPVNVAAIANRSARHLMDKDSLEGHLVSTNGTGKCPTCRHPHNGSIDRANLLIDTALQDEIVGFLRIICGQAGENEIRRPAAHSAG